MGNIDVKERKISSRASDESKKKIPYHKLKIKFERFESYIRKCKAFFFFFSLSETTASQGEKGLNFRGI